MKKVALPSKRRKVFWAFGIFLGLMLISLGVVLYLLTRPVHIQFAQDPNPLEAHEATRKLDLLNEARGANRRGFIRLSEVEINSYLEKSYNPESVRTNDMVRAVKSGVLLHPTNLTFVTWMKVEALGVKLPLIWQRTVSPVREHDRWGFNVEAMRLGRINVPKACWPEIEEFLGPADRIFSDRETWLAEMPNIALVENELSTAPELRLYTYEPSAKSGL